MITLKNQQATIKIEEGELVSFVSDGHEFIHQKGSPGWSSSDTEMFPIIGPVSEAQYKVQTPNGFGVQDQHGLLRELRYELQSQSEVSAVFVKKYTAGSTIKNSKYPKNSSVSELTWPYDFRFQKSFFLIGKTLEIKFAISGEKDMPFMLGYHPAFKLHTNTPTIHTDQRNISLEQVLEVGGRALQLANSNAVTLKDEKEITIETDGFNHFMCWTEVRNMVCIEPISFYPYAVSQSDLHLGFQHLGMVETIFTVRLKV